MVVTQSWLVHNHGWYTVMVGTQSWLGHSHGWYTVMVGTQSWLGHSHGWKTAMAVLTMVSTAILSLCISYTCIRSSLDADHIWVSKAIVSLCPLSLYRCLINTFILFPWKKTCLL